VDERIRVVIAGPGPDGGDRAAEVVARALRDAGMEVVYTDRPQAPEQLAATVVQEDADAVGVLVAEGDPTPVARLVGLLADRGVEDVLVFAGEDVARADVAHWLRERLSS
jgi:methylmalonyl-CoA mutase C-terminal domain/subunit